MRSGKYEGMDRFECRKQLVQDLKDQDLVIKIEEHTRGQKEQVQSSNRIYQHNGLLK